jgi:23S rRNA pseudouridine1911/1915/1917 synthase
MRQNLAKNTKTTVVPVEPDGDRRNPLEVFRRSRIIRPMQMRQVKVRNDQAGSTLQDFLSGLLGLSRNRAKALLDSRQVFVNGRRIWMTRHALRPGDAVEVPIPSGAPPPPAPVPVLFTNKNYVVAGKPPGRLSNGPASLETDLRRELGIASLLAVHRLDRDTSGCLLLAKGQEAFDRAVELFKQHRILKLYQVIVAGHLRGPEQTIDKPLENEPAVTHLQVLDSTPLASHVKARIETGRTHQIRKHLESIGHPVLGDKTYGTRQALPSELRHIERQMLHAATLQFESPYDGEKIRVTAPLPGDFVACLRKLGLK